ncbi:hypothetical protein ACJX0J_035866, partial [Zea mays]
LAPGLFCHNFGLRKNLGFLFHSRSACFSFSLSSHRFMLFLQLLDIDTSEIKEITNAMGAAVGTDICAVDRVGQGLICNYLIDHPFFVITAL